MPQPTTPRPQSHDRSRRWIATGGLVLIACLASPADARLRGAAPAKGSIEKATGVWVEGPGFDITYGKTYEDCAQRCLANSKCAMIEFYRPEKKCNLYDTMRPRKPGGSSVVGIRR